MQIRKSKPAAYFDKPSMNVHAVTSQFKQFRTEVADAIREIEGTDDPINPKDFASKIKNMSGGSSDPFVYYKINYDPFWDPEMGMDSSSAISPYGLLGSGIGFLNLYSFIVTNEEQITPPISRCLQFSGSSDLQDESSMYTFLYGMKNERILGFCLCTKKHTLTTNKPDFIEVAEGGIHEQLTSFVLQESPDLDLSKPELSEALVFIKKALDHLFVPITEEEYYALSNPTE